MALYTESAQGTYAALDQHFDVPLGDRGRVVVPAAIRKHLGLEPGDRIIFSIEVDGSVQMLSFRKQLRELNGIFATLEPEGNWSDELIEARREEAKRESPDEGPRPPNEHLRDIESSA
jgi:AbrB family looped-hinge helix DNA binding protein